MAYITALFYANEIPFHSIPPYPHGVVQIEGHEPLSGMWFVVGVTIGLVVARAGYQRFVPAAGQRFGAWLHGARWLEAGRHGATLDWQRFADVCFFATEHVASTCFVLTVLGRELLSWVSDPAGAWFAFHQPALSWAVRTYYLAQLGVSIEAALTMAVNVARGRAKDGPMVAHHAATLFVILVANRLHFVRIGVFILALHDATDIPIDGIHLSRAFQSKRGLVVSALSGIVSWALLRGWVFPRHVLGPIIFESRALPRLYIEALDWVDGRAHHTNEPIAC